MSSYQAGFGLKKPLNLMEAPILSDIKQGPPLFKDARQILDRRRWSNVDRYRR